MENNVTNDLMYRHITGEYIDQVMDIQSAAFAVMSNPMILRDNSRETLLDCLEHHYAIGAFDGERLVAFSILYFAGDSDENLAQYLYPDAEDYSIYANSKLVIVHPEYRGRGLQRILMGMLEEPARCRGIKELFCTISPDNSHSQDNMKALGYETIAFVSGKYGQGSDRDVLSKKL